MCQLLLAYGSWARSTARPAARGHVTHLLRANVFIQAKNLHYGFDFCPAFWSWLDEQRSVENVFSIERVYDELRAATDDLASCVEARQDFFLRPDASIVPSLCNDGRFVRSWRRGHRSSPSGDYYLVAHTHAKTFHRRDARDPCELDEEDQDPGRLHRPRHQVR